MKIKLFVAAAATVVTSSVMAQSAFQGFYGQLGTGYESNSTTSGNITTKDTNPTWAVSNQNFSGAPIVLGAGYNYSFAPKWLIGLGADYSFLPQTSSTYSATNPSNGSNGAGGQLTGSSYKVSNRYNIFLTPGYEIDKDKLVYLKAGYSSVSLTNTFPTRYVDNGNAASNSAISAGTQSKTLNGYILGLGYKQMVTSNIYGFAEGNYMSYSKANFSTTTGTSSLTSNPGLSSYTLLVGLGYKF
jgi:opacity protein-like surface antigen